MEQTDSSAMPLSTKLHAVTSQKNLILMLTAVRQNSYHFCGKQKQKRNNITTWWSCMPVKEFVFHFTSILAATPTIIINVM
jgi:hypothetical protein